MRVVFLTSRMPYPPEGGDRFRVFHLIRTASEAGHEVHLVTFDSASRPPRGFHGPLERMLASIGSCRLPKLRSPRFAPRKALTRTSRSRPRTTGRAGCADASGEALRRVRSGRGRHAPLPHGALRARADGGAPARWILDLTDVISAGIERSLPYRSGPDLWIYREEMRRIGRYEAEIAPRFDECWVISEAERQCHLGALAPGRDKRVVIPNGLGPEPFPTTRVPRGSARGSSSSDSTRSSTTGTPCASSSARSFRASALRYPRRRSTSRGRGPRRRGAGRAVPGCASSDTCPRLEDAFARATVFVAPHRFAAGVQNKVVHALATGTPVVSTPAVRDGLEPVPEGVLRVGETADGDRAPRSSG